MSPPSLRASSFIAVPVFLGLVLISLAWLRPAPDATTESSPAEGLAPGSAAMRAVINPETGELEISAGMPALTLDPATKQALSRSDEGLTPVYHPDGSVSVNLQGRFQSASVARVDDQGKVIVCTEHAEEACSVLDGRHADAAAKAVTQ